MPDVASAQPAWAVFLDFDGTLVDIAERPDGIVVPPDLVASLNELRRACGGAAAIVTGRSVSTIDGFLPGLELDICGLHGLERRVAGRTERITVANLASFRTLAAEVVSPFANSPGVVIENKGESVAFHWRQAPGCEQALRNAAERLAAVEGFRLQEGKALVEVVPCRSGKGHAIAALMAQPPYRHRRPLFAGDDVTDEHAFPTVNQLGGVTVKIGEGSTSALRRVATPAALRSLLLDGGRAMRTVDDLDAA